MEYVPLITIKNKKIQNNISIEDIENKIKPEQNIYIFDIDGIEKDKPNLCTYQKISKTNRIWVDCGPRTFGDVVDALTAGAESITIRQEYFSKININSIKEITENKIYKNITLEEDSFEDCKNYDGLTLFIKQEDLEYDYQKNNALKQITQNFKLYLYDTSESNEKYWETKDIQMQLINIEEYLGKQKNE